MSSIEKLIERFKSKPKDFTWGELARLLNHFDYEETTGSGSRRKFIRELRQPIILLEPHPGRILKIYQLKLVYEALKEEKLI